MTDKINHPLFVPKELLGEVYRQRTTSTTPRTIHWQNNTSSRAVSSNGAANNNGGFRPPFAMMMG